MVERENRTRDYKSKTSEWLLYVLRKIIQWGQLSLSTMLGYTTKKGEEMIDRVKTIFELRKVDQMMRERANNQMWHENVVKEGKKMLPQVWGDDDETL